MSKNFQARNNKNIRDLTAFALLSLCQNDTSISPTAYKVHGHRIWKDISFSASQEIPRMLWKPKFQCCVHKSPILRKMNPVHVIPSFFSKIHICIKFPSSNCKLCHLRSVFQRRLRVKEVAQGWMDYIKIQKAVDVSTNVKMALLSLINVQKVTNSTTIQNYVV